MDTLIVDLGHEEWCRRKHSYNLHELRFIQRFGRRARMHAQDDVGLMGQASLLGSLNLQNRWDSPSNSISLSINMLERIDESNFTYGPKQSKTSEFDAKTSDFDSCETNSSVETLESVPEPVVVEPKVVSQPKVWSDAPIIEEYESDSDDEYHVKTPRETVKEQNTCSPSPKVNKRDWNGSMSKRLGLGYGFTKKACFVCGSFSHLIRDCDFHEKRMAKQVELNKQKGKGTGQGENRPVWNNVQRLNHQNKFVPKAVLTKTGIFSVNTARQNPFSQAAETSTTRKVNTARPIVNEIRQRNNFYKSHSPIRRPFNISTTPKANFTNHKVNTARDKTVSAVRGYRETAVKASAGCNWRPKRHYWNKVSKYNSGSNSNKNVNFKDPLGRPKSAMAWKERKKISDDIEVLLEEEETVELVEEPTELVEDQGSGEKREQEVTTADTTLNTSSVPISTVSATPEVSIAAANLVYIRRSAEKRKDKGKAIMIEDESVQKKSKKQLEQERLSHEEAIRLQEQIDEEERKRIARDAEIAKQLQEEYDKAGKKEAVAEVDTAHVIDWNDPSVIRYHALQNRPRSVAEVRKNMIMYLKNQGGYKMKDFKGMSYDDIRPIFEKIQRRINVELSNQIPIIGWEVYSEDTMQFWKIIRVGNYTEMYQVFEDMLKNFDRDDLVKLWSLVQERYNSSGLTEDKEIELWVELKMLFEPDAENLLELQKYMHDPLKWWLYDMCAVHHVSTEKGQDIFMLVEKDYPLTKGLATLMLCNKLRVDQQTKLSTARPKLSTDSTKIESMKLEAMVEERRIFKCWFHYHTTNGHQFTMSNRHQELASPEQTASGKDFSNPLMADSLPKNYLVLNSPCFTVKSWLVQSKRLLVKTSQIH
ncbi:hypothetical protein Tco_0267174 [Tanacetum coccineum]